MVDEAQPRLLLPDANHEASHLGIGTQCLRLLTLTAVEVRQLCRPMQGLLIVFYHPARIKQYSEHIFFGGWVGIHFLTMHQPLANQDGGVVFHVLVRPRINQCLKQITPQLRQVTHDHGRVDDQQGALGLCGVDIHHRLLGVKCVRRLRSMFGFDVAIGASREGYHGQYAYYINKVLHRPKTKIENFSFSENDVGHFLLRF